MFNADLWDFSVWSSNIFFLSLSKVQPRGQASIEANAWMITLELGELGDKSGAPWGRGESGPGGLTNKGCSTNGLCFQCLWKVRVYIYICMSSCFRNFHIQVKSGSWVFWEYFSLCGPTCDHTVVCRLSSPYVFSDFVGELGLRMLHLKEFNLLRVLRQLCSCLIRIGAIGEASGATSCRRAHARENFGFRH